ncbi:hypothetical protein GCM10010106_18840 [Thermopolyspora flexuosa]|jgi:hypothetical protein|uniref:Transposase n=1 Tax=Thermopolyspora flexuosa TaxID=103836 RepID=A0A543J3Y1_9ACTN|nr:hypothetical protein FHX40_4295 [Thermopolyspora flexuosa]GGM72681.1 hypothetical protein GCM10010106_18840 [Thermopolyspora flexuosa]
MSRWIGADGWEVEPIRLNGSTVLRIRHNGYHVAYARSIAELTRHGIDIADLVEVADLPR